MIVLGLALLLTSVNWNYVNWFCIEYAFNPLGPSLTMDSLVEDENVIINLIWKRFYGGININNWIELSHSEEDTVWKKVYKEFKFKPSISRFPSFKIPKPFITYDVSNYLNGSGDLEEYEKKNKVTNKLFMCEKITNIKRIGGSERQHEVTIEVVTFEQAHEPPYDLFKITLTDIPEKLDVPNINVTHVERKKNLSDQQLNKQCGFKSH